MAFLSQLAKYYKTYKICVYLDNARSHTTDNVKRIATDLGITLIYNLPYRPDCNGIENVWVHAKAAYKTRKLKYMMMGMPWTNETLVRESLDEVDAETVKKALNRGFEALENAEPINPPSHEELG